MTRSKDSAREISGVAKETAVPGRGHRDASFGQFGRIDIGTAFLLRRRIQKSP